MKKNPYLFKKKINNVFYVYEREYLYDSKKQNSKSTKETYKGIMLTSRGTGLIYINSKVIKEKSLTSFLQANESMFLEVVDSKTELNRSQGLFLLGKGGKQLDKKKINSSDKTLPPVFGVVTVLFEERFILEFQMGILKKIRIVSDKEKKDDENRLSIFNEASNNLIGNICRGSFSDFIILSKSNISKLETLELPHNGVKNEELSLYIYSDSDELLKTVKSISCEYLLIKKIVGGVKSLVEKIEAVNEKDYLISQLAIESLKINKLFLEHGSRGAVRSIRENPFPIEVAKESGLIQEDRVIKVDKVINEDKKKEVEKALKSEEYLLLKDSILSSLFINRK